MYGSCDDNARREMKPNKRALSVHATCTKDDEHDVHAVSRKAHPSSIALRRLTTATLTIAACRFVAAVNSLAMIRLRPAVRPTSFSSTLYTHSSLRSAPRDGGGGAKGQRACSNSSSSLPFYLHPSASIVQVSETGERGIQVVGDGVKNGTVLLSVPLERIILPERGRRETPVGRALVAKMKEVVGRTTSSDYQDIMGGDGTYLTLWLCHALHRQREKRQEEQQLGKVKRDALDNNEEIDMTKESSYSQYTDMWYLESLPKGVTNLPVFWSESDLAELQGSRVKLQTRIKRTQWISLYNRIATDYAPNLADETSLQDFLYARALVETRAFRLRRTHFEDLEEQAVERPFGLVPLADMLNHRSRSYSSTCDWRYEQEGINAESFVIRTSEKRGLALGDEARISYGLQPNTHYLNCYGFALEEEENRRHDGASPNKAHIDLFFGGGDEGSGECGFPMKLQTFAVAIGDKRASEALLSKVRILVATDEEKCSIISQGSGSSSTAKKDNQDTEKEESEPTVRLECPLPFSLRNERAAVTKLRRSVEDAVRRYDTTLEEDLELLQMRDSCVGKEGEEEAAARAPLLPAFTNRRNAVLVRSGEKRVLRHWQYLCDAALFFLDDVERSVKDWSEYCAVLEASLTRTTSIAS